MLHPGERLADGGDAVLNAWILAWNARALANSPSDIWNAPIYHPTPNVLAFSETMFGNLWVTLPVQYLTGNHVLAANTLVMVSFVLGMYTTFLLVYRLTNIFWAGVGAGVVFSFNPYRWAEVHHLQLLPFFWAPIALLGWHTYLERRRLLPLIVTASSMIAQTYASLYLGIILFITLVVFTTAYLATERCAAMKWNLWRDGRLYVAMGAGCLALLPLALPYTQVVRDWNFSRSESENATFSAEPLSLLIPNESFQSYSGISSALTGQVRGAHGLGLAPWLLATMAIGLGNRQAPNRVRSCFAWTALGMAVLMLGPYLIWFNQKTDVPLPYLLMYHVIPGAKAMRVPSRFVFPLLLCLAVLAGYAVAALAVRWRGWSPVKRFAICVTGVLLLAFDYRVADHQGAVMTEQEEFPPVYSYLAATRPNEPVLELPADVRKQFSYLHYQTAHWRPLVGGETGCYTRAVLEVAERTKGAPTDRTLDFLRLTPASTVVIHLDRYEPDHAYAWEVADLSGFGFSCVGRMGDALVWERQGPDVVSSKKLRITDVAFERRLRFLSDGWHIELTVQAAEAGLPWRHLERGVSELDIALISADGAEHHYSTPVPIPPYLVAGETTKVVVGKLRGGPSEVHAIRVRGAVLEEYQTD